MLNILFYLLEAAPPASIIANDYDGRLSALSPSLLPSNPNLQSPAWAARRQERLLLPALQIGRRWPRFEVDGARRKRPSRLFDHTRRELTNSKRVSAKLNHSGRIAGRLIIVSLHLASRSSSLLFLNDWRHANRAPLRQELCNIKSSRRPDIGQAPSGLQWNKHTSATPEFLKNRYRSILPLAVIYH